MADVYLAFKVALDKGDLVIKEKNKRVASHSLF